MKEASPTQYVVRTASGWRSDAASRGKGIVSCCQTLFSTEGMRNRGWPCGKGGFTPDFNIGNCHPIGPTRIPLEPSCISVGQFSRACEGFGLRLLHHPVSRNRLAGVMHAR